MEYPVKVYGLNLFELVLADLLNIFSWLVIAFPIVVLFQMSTFSVDSIGGGILLMGTFVVGVTLSVAAAGIRQNRPSLNLGLGLFFIVGLGWLTVAIINGNVASGITGFALEAAFAVAFFLRKQAIKARFKPRFFTLREFETMIQIADTMMETDGEQSVSPIEVAIRVDHMMARIDSPSRQVIKQVMLVVEWLLPLLTLFRPVRFSDLGSHERRRAVEAVIDPEGLLGKLLKALFRDVARSLKMLASAGYYGDPRGMAQVGFVPFDDRPRAQGIDQEPKIHKDPFSGGGVK